jgi:Mg2+-importing ATPase
MAIEQSSSLAQYWSKPAQAVLAALSTSEKGLTADAARESLSKRQALSRKRPQMYSLKLLAGQFASPIIILLLAVAILSAYLGDVTDCAIIFIIILAGSLLSFWQEYGAHSAVQQLLRIVETKATVIREGKVVEIPAASVVAGDIVQLSAGDTIPGDCLILSAKDIYVDEAALTGETFPVQKQPGELPAESGLSERTNSLFMGTHVVSGTATAVVVKVGEDTEFGKVQQRLQAKVPETDFERGVRRNVFARSHVDACNLHLRGQRLFP